MKLFHVSTDIFKNITEFVPRIPKSRLKTEDGTIPRICVATNILDCLNGISYEHSLSNKLFHDNHDCYELVGDNYRAVKVYEFEYTGSKLLTPTDIKDLVPDALSTNEHWITETIKPIRDYIISIDYLDIDINSNLINNFNFSVIKNPSFHKKATIYTHENFEEIHEAIQEFTISHVHNSDDSSIQLNIGEFPIDKKIIEKILHDYFSWADNMTIKFE